MDAGVPSEIEGDIYDYYIKNNLYSDFRTYNETHPWSEEEIKKYMTLKTVIFFADYSEKGYLINWINKADKEIRIEPVILTACIIELPEIVMYFIMSGKCDITALGNSGSTLLTKLSFYDKYSNIVMLLISTMIIKLKPLIGFQNKHGYTALIYACYYKTEVALALIATGESNPGVQTKDGFTALINACYSSGAEVALALIATGESNPGAQTKCGHTALINACYRNTYYRNMTAVALAILATGESNPGAQVIKNGHTALIIACKNHMTEVALAILATGDSNPLAVDENMHDALYYAKTPELKFWIRREQAYFRRRYLVFGMEMSK